MDTTTTTCSGCSAALTLTTATVTARVPSNGLRGSKHVPAHTVQADVFTTDTYGDDLLLWDCPVCGYADSYDTTQ